MATLTYVDILIAGQWTARQTVSSQSHAITMTSTVAIPKSAFGFRFVTSYPVCS